MPDSTEWSLWNGTQMERARADAGLSLAKLAERCKDLGVPIHRVAISKIEAGERIPTVDEITVIAVALNTSPAMLLFGADLVDGSVEVLPGLRTAASHALQWLSGQESLLPDTADEYRRANYPIALAHRLAVSEEVVRRSVPLLKTEIDHNPDLAEYARDILIDHQKQLDMVRNEIRDRGLHLSGDDADT